MLCTFGLDLLNYILHHRNMITRFITEELLTLTSEYPVVTILGPRQAGKTTFGQAALVYNGDSHDLSDGTRVRHFTEVENLLI